MTTPVAASEADKPTTSEDLLDSPELAALKKEKALLAERVEIAQNRQKLVNATLPGDVKPLEGTVAVEGDPMESQILAYQVLNRLAAEVATEVANVVRKDGAREEGTRHQSTAVVIHNEADINILLALPAFLSQVELIEKGLDAEVQMAVLALDDARGAATTKARPKAAVATAAVIAGGLIRSAVDLLSYFQTNVTLKYASLTIGDLALVAAVGGKLADMGVTVFDPARMPPGLFTTTSDMRDRLGGINQKRAEIDGVQREIASVRKELMQQIETLDKEIDAAAGQPASTQALQGSRELKQKAADGLAAADARLTAAVTALIAFQTALLKTDDNSGLNALTRVLRAEKLHALGADAHWLVLKVAAAGGGYKTEQSRIWRSKTSYSGGAVVDYALFAPSGQLCCARVLPGYVGFIHVDDRDATPSNLA